MFVFCFCWKIEFSTANAGLTGILRESETKAKETDSNLKQVNKTKKKQKTERKKQKEREKNLKIEIMK